MLNDERDRQIVRTAINLAHTFDFSVVAEGVETAAILNDLIDLNCDIAQGFLYAKALPQQDFIRWLERYRPSDYVQEGSVHGEINAVATDTSG